MRRLSLFARLLLVLGTLMLSTCGGEISSTPVLQPPPNATTHENQETLVTVTLSTAVSGAIPAATTINSYAVTITLPGGVTVKSTMNPPETDAGVVSASGAAAGATAVGRYTEATISSPGTVKVYIVKVDPATGAGFDAGEFCVVKASIASDKDPSAVNFPAPTLDDATGFNAATASTVVDLEKELSLQAGIVIN